MLKFLVILLSLILCPIATVKSIWHIRLGWKHSKHFIYCFNLRYLMYCNECNEVFVNELTQREVDMLDGPPIQRQDKD